MDQSQVNGEPGYLNLKSQLVPIPIGSSFYDLDSCKRTKTIIGKYYFINPRVISTKYECLAMFLLINGLKLDEVKVDEETKKQVLRQLSRRVKHKVVKQKPDLWKQYRDFEVQLEPFNFKHMELYGQVAGFINGNTIKVIFDVPIKALSRWHMHHDKNGNVNKRYVAIPYGDRNAGLIIEHNVKIFGLKGETRETKKGKAQIEVLKSFIHENTNRVFVHLLGYIQGGFVRGHVYMDATKKVTLAEQLMGIQHPKFSPLYESAFTESKNGMEYQSVKQVKGRFRVKQQKKKYDYGTEHGNHINPVQAIEYDEDATRTVKKRDQKAVKAVNKVNKQNKKKLKKKPDATLIGLPDNLFEDPDLTIHKSNFILPELEAKDETKESHQADEASEPHESENEENESGGPMGLPLVKASGGTLNEEELKLLARAAKADTEQKKKKKGWKLFGRKKNKSSNNSETTESEEEGSETAEVETVETE